MRIENYTIDDFIGDESFQKYYFELNKEDILFWESWISNHQDKSTEVEKAKNFLSQLNLDVETLSQEEFQDEFFKLKSKLLPEQKEAQTKVRRNISIGNTSVWFNQKMAAAILLLIMFGVGFYFLKNKLMNSQLPQHTEITFTEKYAPLGKKSSFQLPDGTRVKLNSGTSLKIYPDFNSKDRKVLLEGEAFFEVKKDKSKPFIIESGELTTTVKGTSFNIKAFANEDAIEVAVATGLVSVSKFKAEKSEFQMLLEPEEMLIYNPDTENFSKKNFDRETVLGWKDGILSFKEVNFEAIKKDLEKWYGVEITVNNKMVLHRPYTGTYQNSSLDKVLEGMSFVLGFEFKIENNNVYIN